MLFGSQSGFLTCVGPCVSGSGFFVVGGGVDPLTFAASVATVRRPSTVPVT